MKNAFFRIIVLVALFSVPKMVFGSVVINEIMYDLETGSDSGREWVEIFNNSDMVINLTSWKLWENGTNHGLTVFQGDINILQNGYAIIVDNPEKFLIDNPGYSGTVLDSTFSLSNDGENLVLKDNNLNIIDEVSYSSSWGANGNSRSLQKEIPNGTIWGSGISTPGTLNSISPETPAQTSEEPEEESIASASSEVATDQSNAPPIADAGDNIIAFTNQEIKLDGTKSSDPEGRDLQYSWNMGDGNSLDKVIIMHKYPYPGTYLATLSVFDGKYYASDTITIKIQNQGIVINEFMVNPSGTDSEEEWIEVYNDNNSIADISGWRLDDIASGSKAFVFPTNTLIAPKNYLVFTRQATKIALNNDKDSVRLLMPDGTVFQEINYEKPPQGKSSSRTAEGFVWTEPSPGMANVSGIAISSNKKTALQTNTVKTETVKNSTKDLVINLPKNEISGGYATINSNDQIPMTNNINNNELAGIKQTYAQEPINLVLLIIAIVFGAGFIGLFLIKIKKKSPAL